MKGDWGDGWKRLGEANKREHIRRLRSRTPEESIAIFEELTRVRTGLEGPPLRRTHAVGLAKFWRSR